MSSPTGALRCAIYIRVSTEEQVERARLREQQERLPALARERGWSYTVLEDLGVSGRTIGDRPGMRRLLQMISADEIDVVLVIEQSRLTRDTTLEDLGHIIRACQEHGVAIATPERIYRPDDLDDFVMLGIQGVLSAAEVRRFVKRAQEGINRTASEGRYTGGIVPYGYRVGSDGHFQIYEPEAAIVRDMYAWLIDDRLTLYQIQRRLNDLGVPPPNEGTRSPDSDRDRGKRSRKTSRRWQGFTVKRILSSSFYCGERVYGKRARQPRSLVTGAVPAIVDRARHHEAQVRLAEQRARHSRGQRYDYLLKGKIRCAACGHAYTGATDQTVQHGTVRRYACTSNGRENERGFSCNNPSVRADILEPLVWRDVCRFLSMPDLVLTHFEQQSDEQQAALLRHEEQRRSLRDRRAALVEEIERWLDVYPRALSGLTAGVTADDVDRKVAELRAQAKRLDTQIARLDLWTERLEVRNTRRKNLEELLRDLQARLHSASESERTAIVHELVLKIEIEAERDADGKPTFHYERRHRPDGSFWYAQRVPHVNVTVVYRFPEAEIPAKKEAEERAHAHRFIVPMSWKREGKSARPPTRATATTPSSSGWRRASSAERVNSGSSSSMSTPRWASVTSPGRGPGPPPTIAATEAL
jgi:site-specific DNA recombinase